MVTMREHPFAYVFLACLVMTQAVHGKRRSQDKVGESDPEVDTKYGLNLSVKLNRDNYRLADTPKVTICLKNVGSSPLVLYKEMLWGVSSSLFLWVVDARGRLLDKTVLADYQDRPPFAKNDFVTLEPGQSIEVKDWLDFEGEGLTGPGRYTVTVRYRSPVSLDFAPKGKNVFVEENGVLLSKPVAFEVTQ